MIETIEGRNAGDVMLYGLSTCMWCKKTKKLLDEMGVKYTYAFIDLMDEETKKHYHEEMKVWNPRGSFPTLVIDDRKTIIGYDEARIREVLK